MLGLENIKGLGFLKDFSLEGLIDKVSIFLLVCFVAVVIAVIGIAIYYFISQWKLYKEKLVWFEEVQGQMAFKKNTQACELTIPNSSIKVFYDKANNLYLPRPVKRMGVDTYWYCIRNNRELVNFAMTNMNKDMKEAGLEYDHTDMRYALTNLKELIKRNYRDNAAPWWREYKEVIGLVILIFVLSVSIIFVLSKVGSVIGQLSPVIEKLGGLIDQIAELQKTTCSGVGSGIARK